MRLAAAACIAVLAASCTGEPTVEGPAPTPTRAPEASFSWETIPSLPTPRTEVAAAAAGSRLAVAGGFIADGRSSNLVEVYEQETGAWARLPSLLEPRHHTALVSIGEDLYLLGGYGPDGRGTDTVWRLSPDAESWEELPRMPRPRGAHAAAVVDGRIHVVGGASSFTDDGRLLTAHDVFDPDAGTWTSAADFPEPRDHLAAASVDGALYAVGGRKQSLTTNTSRVDVFADGEWTRIEDMPTPRGGLAAAVMDGLVFVFGGEEPEGTFGAAEFWSPASEEWLQAPDMPTPRHGLGAATLAGRIVVVGGGTEPGLSVSGAAEVLSGA